MRILFATIFAASCFAQNPIPNPDALRAEVLAQVKGATAAAMSRIDFDRDRDRAAYDRGIRELDARRYEEAIRLFDAASADASRQEGALYWKAYALMRVGQNEQAQAMLTALQKQHPDSRWLDDAKALEAELKQGTNRRVSAADEANEDLKLMAINSLMNADPERAVPLLEGLLKGTSSRKLKDRALFVLTQSKSPQAQQLLGNYAKGSGNPDLQIRAIRYVGMSQTAAAQQQLAGIYGASSDGAVKTEIIRALYSAHAYEKIAELARTEKDVKLKTEAIRHMGMSRQTTTESLAAMYAAEADAKVKQEIVNAFQSRNDAKGLVEIARKEPDPVMKRHIVSRLANMRNSKEATDYMMELLK